MTISKVLMNADHGPAIVAGLLSAFGVSDRNPFLVPANIRPEHALEWARWINTKQGEIAEDKTVRLSRLLRFVRMLRRKGRRKIIIEPLTVMGQRIKIDDCETFFAMTLLAPHMLRLLEFMKTTELQRRFRVVTTRSTSNEDWLFFTLVLERRKKNTSLDAILVSLRDKLKFKAVPAPLREQTRTIVTPSHKFDTTLKPKIKILTPKASQLLEQRMWARSMPIRGASVALARAADSRLVIRTGIEQSVLFSMFPPASLYKVWERLYQKCKPQ